jgi:hypothetical protein
MLSRVSRSGASFGLLVREKTCSSGAVRGSSRIPDSWLMWIRLPSSL